MMLSISRKSVRHGYRLYAGAFTALCFGVVLIAMAVTLTGAVEETATHGDVTRAEREQLDGLASMFGMMSGIAVFLAMFVVASTFAFMVAARRREVGLLRLVGATPRQVRRMVLGESLVVAVLATVAGCLLTMLLAPLLVLALPAIGVTDLRLRLPDPGLAWAFAAPAGIGVALVGSWRASKRASRVPALAALQEAAIERRRPSFWQFVIGTVCLVPVAGAVLLLHDVEPLFALLTAILLPEVAVIGFACFGGVLFPRLAGLLARPFAGRDVTARLARDQLVASSRTPASIAAPVMAISAIAGSMILAVGFTADWTTAMNRAQLGVPTVVSTAGDASVVSRLRSAPGVGVVDPRVTAEVRLGPERERETVEVVSDVGTTARARGLRAERGSLAGLARGGIAVTSTYASDLGTRVGSRLPVNGTRREVVAVVPDAPDLYGEVLVPPSVLGRSKPDAPEFVFVNPAGADLGTALAGSPAQVLTAEAWLTEIDSNTREANELGLWVLLGPAALYAGIAIVNAVLMGATQRRRALRTVALLGATRVQRRRTAMWEAGLVGAAALLVGGVITTYTGWLVRESIARSVPDAPLTMPWLALGAVVAVCLALTLVAAAAGARSERSALVAG